MSLDCRPEYTPPHVDSSVLQTTESSRRSSSLGDIADDQEMATAPAASVGSEPSLQSSSITLSFRVTGAASVARLHPLLLGRQWYGGAVAWMLAARDGAEVVAGRGGSDGDDGDGCNGKLCVPDFVWETTVTKDQRQRHRSARVLNRLSGAQVLEDKANLVHLQRLMTAPTLESYIAAGRTEVDRWANLRFRPDSTKILQPPEQGSKAQLQHSAGGELEGDWWCVKASGGNGGMDVWVMDEGNWMAVVEQLHETEEYVIQRYVARPLLWRGRKFHFRCYATLSADLSSWLYRRAYILCASRPYTLGRGAKAETGLADDLVHISNLAVNKHTKGHPGQVPCDIPSEFPSLWPRMLELLRSLVEAAEPFMEHQAGTGHFEFLGLDVLADEMGGVWLIEVNRLPGLQSSEQNMKQEDEMYDTMMVDVVNLLVLPELIGYSPKPGLFEVATKPSPRAHAPSEEVWRNVMRFAAFKRRNRRRSFSGS